MLINYLSIKLQVDIQINFTTRNIIQERNNIFRPQSASTKRAKRHFDKQ